MSGTDPSIIETGARTCEGGCVDRKSVVVIVVLVVAAVGFLLVRDPVGSAGAVRSGWELLVQAVTVVVNSLITFFHHLVQ